jgi:hypothetical protein
VSFANDTTKQMLMGKNDKITFYFRGVQHSVTVTDITATNVTLSVMGSSVTTVLNLSVNQTKTAPLDFIGGDDLSIRLNSISYGKANLTFKLMPQTASNITPAETTNVRETTNTGSENVVIPKTTTAPSTIDNSGMTVVDLDAKGNKVLIIAIAILSVLLIAAVALIIFMKTGVVHTDPAKSRAAKRKKLRDKLAKMQQEIEETQKKIRKVR